MAINVLIVDDSATMRMILIKSLRQAGFDEINIIEASGAKEGLQKIAVGDIGLVLSDVNMPDISGIEMVKVVKTKMPHLPIIMVTTESSPEMRQKMRDAGANGVITKPFPPLELLKILGPIINKK